MGLLSKLFQRNAYGSAPVNFSLELPGPADKPLWRVEVQMHAEPQGEGEKLRLRAHVQTNFASALKPALTAAAPERPALTGGERAGRAVQRVAQRALANPAVRLLAEPLLQHDLNTWVEVHASTAALEDGARGLLPQSARLAELGMKPRRERGEGPVAETWMGEAGQGFAQVTLLEMEKKHLPPQLQSALGAAPFQFAAAVVNTLEKK